jgi:hypothetical protein
MSASVFDAKNPKRFEDIVYKDLSPEDQKIYDKMYGVMGDRDGNGQSDFMDDEYCQSLLKGNLDGVVLRGVTYKSFEEMPEDIRVKMQQAFNSLFPMGMLSPLVYELLMKKKF